MKRVEPLFAERLRDPLVVPVTGTPSGPKCGGVLRTNGTVVEHSQLWRGVRETVIGAPEVQSAGAHLNGLHIFGGFAIHHFGHFLLESCSRLWIAARHPDVPIIWAGGGKLLSYMQETFEILGIRNPSIFPHVPTTVEDLLVPEPAFRIRSYCHPDFVSLMGKVPYAPDPRLKIWLSRSALAGSRQTRVIGETQLEDSLRSAGWFVLHPEEHSLTNQVNLYASCSEIAGFQGSAFHALLLLREFTGMVTLFERGNSGSRNFAMIAEAKGLNQKIIRIPMTLTESGADSPPQLSLCRADDILRELGAT